MGQAGTRACAVAWAGLAVAIARRCGPPAAGLAVRCGLGRMAGAVAVVAGGALAVGTGRSVAARGAAGVAAAACAACAASTTAGSGVGMAAAAGSCRRPMATRRCVAAVMPTTTTTTAAGSSAAKSATTTTTTGIAPRTANANRHPPQHDRRGTLSGGGLESGDDFARDAALDQLFDVAQEDIFVDAGQRNRLALGPGAAGAADAVHIVFGHVGQLEVDDVRQIGRASCRERV